MVLVDIDIEENLGIRSFCLGSAMTIAAYHCWQKNEEKLGNTQTARVLPMYKCTNAQLCTKDARTKPIQTCHAFRACQKVGGMCEKHFRGQS